MLFSRGSGQDQLRRVSLTHPPVLGRWLGRLGPRLGHLSIRLRHEVKQGGADSCWGSVQRQRVFEGRVYVVAERHADDTRACLEDAIIGGVEELPLDRVAQLLDLLGDVRAVVVKTPIQEAPDVFQHDGARLDLSDQADCCGEEVAFVIGSKLLSR